MKKLGLSGLVALLLVGCGGGLTMENYNKLEPGMDFVRVTDLLGEPAKCEEILGAKSCMWGEESKHIKVKFVANNVAFFSKQGL